MGDRWENEKAYDVPDWYERKQLLVTVILDAVPGAMDSIEDHINLMFAASSYTLSVEVIDG